MTQLPRFLRLATASLLACCGRAAGEECGPQPRSLLERQWEVGGPADVADWDEGAGLYRVSRGLRLGDDPTGCHLGFLASRDTGAPAPHGTGLTGTGQRVVIYTDFVGLTHDASTGAARDAAVLHGCWRPLLTPDLCCGDGGWDLCLTGNCAHGVCCAGWTQRKDPALLWEARSAVYRFTSAGTQFAEWSPERPVYTTVYHHALIHAELVAERARASGAPGADGGGLQMAEVGVDEGPFAWHMLTRLAELGVPVSAYYVIDPWLASRENYNTALALLAPFWPVTRLVQERGDRAALMVTDGTLDFVFVDAIHSFLMVTRHLEVWWPKLRPGGVLAGHDFAPEKPHRFPGCLRAVTAFAERVCAGACLVGLPGTTYAMLKGGSH